jgi:hypothetical protein
MQAQAQRRISGQAAMPMAAHSLRTDDPWITFASASVFAPAWLDGAQANAIPRSHDGTDGNATGRNEAAATVG